MPVSKVGSDRPDPKKGNKVEPTTKAPKQKDPHEGHGHKGKT
jgi:hypothetical protein